MKKNNIALKLSLYFALALLVFAIVIGGVFYFLFRNHTMNMHKTELESRAVAISQNMSGVMDFSNSTNSHHGRGRGGQGMMSGGMQNMMPGGIGNYLETINQATGYDIWVVDKDMTLLTSSGHGHGMMMREYEYSDLPVNAEEIVSQTMRGETVFSEGFSDILNETTLTVGTPVWGANQEVVGAVLLHSPVHGTTEAIAAGWKILTTSIVIALVLAIILSVWLSKSFTDPIVSKEAMDALRLENARREFIANISHELNTPVTVIRGSLEALVDEVVTEPEQVEQYHHQLLNETVYLQRLVGDLLDLSRLQNKEFSIEKEKVSVVAVLDDVLRSASSLAKEKDIEIKIKQDQKDYVFLGDYGRLRQMFLVILDNAVKFSDPNSSIEVTKSGNSIYIKDYGVGISSEELPYIFDRFHKSRSEQNKTGTGLGLAIAKQIAIRHDIELEVESELGKGSMFIFNLPDVPQP